MRRSCEWLIAVTLAACGGEPAEVDLTGIYRVDRHVSSRGCMMDTPESMPYAYVALQPGARFTLAVCTSADEASCTALVIEFTDPIEDGWRRGVSSAAVGGEVQVCRLQWTEGTARLAGGSLVIDTTMYAEFIAANSPQCTADEAERRGSAMPCDRHERIDATKL